jgi:hypothetical protein
MLVAPLIGGPFPGPVLLPTIVQTDGEAGKLNKRTQPEWGGGLER